MNSTRGASSRLDKDSTARDKARAAMAKDGRIGKGDGKAVEKTDISGSHQYRDEMKRREPGYFGTTKKPLYVNSNDIIEHKRVKYYDNTDMLNNLGKPITSPLYNNIKHQTSASSMSTFSVMAKDPAILSSSLLRELFMALVGVQIVYIVTNVIASCEAAAIVAGSAVIQAIICHLDARPMSYWVSAFLSTIAAVELVISLFFRINGLEQLQVDPILKWMTIFYASSAVIFVCICCYLATTFARLISHEKKHIQKSLERIKTGNVEV